MSECNDKRLEVPEDVQRYKEAFYLKYGFYPGEAPREPDDIKDCTRDTPKREDGRVEPSLGYAVVYTVQLEKFMRAVAERFKCLPSYASPDPEDGNAHIIRAIDAHQQAMQMAQEEIGRLRTEHLSNCLFHRCSSHLAIPQINKTEHTGAECGACIADQQAQSSLREHIDDILRWRKECEAQTQRAQELEARVRELETDGKILRNVRDQAIKDREEYKQRAKRLQGEVERWKAKALDLEGRIANALL